MKIAIRIRSKSSSKELTPVSMGGREGRGTSSQLICYALVCSILYLAMDASIFNFYSFIQKDIPSPNSIYVNTAPHVSSPSPLTYCSISEVEGNEGANFGGSQNWILHHLLLNIRYVHHPMKYNIPNTLACAYMSPAEL